MCGRYTASAVRHSCLALHQPCSDLARRLQQRNKAIGTFKESEDEDPKSSRVIMLSLEKAASGTNLVRELLPPSMSQRRHAC
jgi:hypothetical protein